MTLIAAAAIVDSLERPTQVLCTQRAYPPNLAGQWELPGGKVESDETPEAAAIREVKEELGLDIELGDILPGPGEGGTWPLPTGNPMQVWWAVTSDVGKIHVGAGHLAARWTTGAKIMDLPWLEGDVPIAEAIREALGQPGRH